MWDEGLQGHVQTRRRLARLAELDKLPQALCFVGPEGVGKATTARAFIRKLLGRSPAPGEGLTHPDLWHFCASEEMPRLKVDTIRQSLLPFARRAPFVGKRALILIEDAERSLSRDNTAVANVLLKTLEEPREGVHFLLTCSRPEALLSTIRSRTQQLRFTALTAAELAACLPSELPEWVAPCAAGSVGRALRLAEKPAVLEQAVGLLEGARSAAGALRGSQEVTAHADWLDTVAVAAALATQPALRHSLENSLAQRLNALPQAATRAAALCALEIYAGSSFNTRLQLASASLRVAGLRA